MHSGKMCTFAIIRQFAKDKGLLGSLYHCFLLNSPLVSLDQADRREFVKIHKTDKHMEELYGATEQNTAGIFLAQTFQ